MDHDAEYPRPLLRRANWHSLDGVWGFAFDDADAGRADRWYEPARAATFTRTIAVPIPPEAPGSGIGERGFHPVVWYRRAVPGAALAPPDDDARVLIHFGAVDFRADVWCDGRHVAAHVGGQSPFSADVTDALTPGADEHVIVVRAEDDPRDLEQPRGKQDWEPQPHEIWYERTTGIWQPVWSEIVAAQHVAELAWTPDVGAASVRGEIALARTPLHGLTVDIALRFADEALATATADVTERTTMLDIAVPALRRARSRDRLLWSPEQPALVDAEVVLRDSNGARLDVLHSYLGLRTVTVGAGEFRLNDRPYPLRGVLNQGYRPDTHLATSGTAELRAEVAVAKAMGFNTVRVHQKAEDPRFLYWADRLGLLVWCETAATYRYSSRAVALLSTEWADLVRRYRSHPSVVAWVPINESWGIPDVATDPAQQHFARALAELTRALDPSRPVLSNEGWEHVDSDILGVHDYTSQPRLLRRRYGSQRGAARFGQTRRGPAGRKLSVTGTQRRAVTSGAVPVMLTEFGGISLAPKSGEWGYATAASADEFAQRLRELFDAVRASPYLAGYCYTQLRDAGGETNGLLRADGSPKLPIETIHAIVTGS
ncbi:MAG TPA: glycoside hydrolase family 2 TIM barrel-domain containing protein [Jatrophihabitans sp.]|nr:glycoside hydrolase family 2 TIM barrel-domain containing protein [Jatrophihabitans sp.]